MPALKTYDLFLSHMWRKNENSEYYRLESLLKNAPNFLWRNYSVPEHDPLGAQSDAQLRTALDRQIRPVNCFLIISGMYASYRKWIHEELTIAQSYNKPIIGIIPQGQVRTPVEVQNASREMVGWNTDSIVSAIRKWAL
jgi:hypothetical protein